MSCFPVYTRATPYKPKDVKKNYPSHRSFTPSYEKDTPSMYLLMSWHYGRQWLAESQELHRSLPHFQKKKKSFIQPGTQDWLLKRMTALTRRARHLDPAVKKPTWI